jgi:thymidylate synthase
MIEGGPEAHPNQLDFVLGQFTKKKGVRRSALQVSVYDPKVDQTNSALLGFPCLQHVTFAPSEEGLCINAFYATQFAVERAYGNYLGLCGLGRFVAHELGLELARITCFTGIMKRDNDLSIAALKPLALTVNKTLSALKAAA